MAQCTAKSKRSQKQCERWAIRGRHTCPMHGGKSTGPRTKVGKERSRMARLKHGEYSQVAKDEYRQAMALIRISKNFLESML